jgi:hypothetical protein
MVAPVGADVGEDGTVSLQAMFDALKPGGTLKLEPRTYQHGSVVQINVPNVKIDGDGATLEATNEAASSLQIRADGVSVSNLNLSAALSGQRYAAPEQDKIYIRANGVTLNNITINGAAATGVFLDNASHFALNRVTVRDSRADGIHMTHGSNNGQVNNPLIERSGDDGVAVVSYAQADYPPCRNIVINSPVVTSTTFGQGISALGGENISYRNINISGSDGAGVFIGTIGAPFFSQSTTGVEVVGGTVNGADVNPGIGMGAVAIYGENPGMLASNITVSNLTISNTPETAQKNIGIWVNGGAVAGINLRNISVQQQTELPVLYSNAPRETYTVSGLTLNGAPFNAP